MYTTHSFFPYYITHVKCTVWNQFLQFYIPSIFHKILSRAFRHGHTYTHARLNYPIHWTWNPARLCCSLFYHPLHPPPPVSCGACGIIPHRTYLKFPNRSHLLLLPPTAPSTAPPPPLPVMYKYWLSSIGKEHLLIRWYSNDEWSYNIQSSIIFRRTNLHKTLIFVQTWHCFEESVSSSSYTFC